MPTSGNEDDFRLGFLAAIEVADRGYVGGLLVTNRFGRPLEFQCTTPVKPNRTQQILYGPTLIPFVLGELIGRTLLEKIGVKPHLVLTELPEILEVRNHVSLPVACLDDEQDASAVSPEESQAFIETSESSVTCDGEDTPATLSEPVTSSDAANGSHRSNGSCVLPIGAVRETVEAPRDVIPMGAVCDESCEPSVNDAATNSENPREVSVFSLSSAVCEQALAASTNSPVSTIFSTCTALAIIPPKPADLQQRAPRSQPFTDVVVAPEPPAAPAAPTAADPPESAPSIAVRVDDDREEQAIVPALQKAESIAACVIGRQKLRFHSAHQTDRELVERRVAALPGEVDLREPFERIREALEETIRSGSGR